MGVGSSGVGAGVGCAGGVEVGEGAPPAPPATGLTTGPLSGSSGHTNFARGGRAVLDGATLGGDGTTLAALGATLGGRGELVGLA